MWARVASAQLWRTIIQQAPPPPPPGLVLQDIEKRLSRPIPALAADLSLPPEIAARVAGGGGGTTPQYGQQRGGGVSQEVMERVQVRRVLLRRRRARVRAV